MTRLSKILRILMIICVSALTTALMQPVFAVETYWNTVDRLNRRTCPSTKCGIVGRKFFREGATVYEIRNGWARITPPYNASCRNGYSEYVDKGNNACDASNGIQDGKFSEWVALKYLSKDRPTDPAESEIGLAKVIGDSDDFQIYRDVFLKAAIRLIDQGVCEEKDFKEVAGFTKSTIYRDQPIYFTYCGGLHKRNKVHLNVQNGKIFR